MTGANNAEGDGVGRREGRPLFRVLPFGGFSAVSGDIARKESACKRAPSASWFPPPNHPPPDFPLPLALLPPPPFICQPLPSPAVPSTLLHARVTRRRFRRVTFNERRWIFARQTWIRETREREGGRGGALGKGEKEERKRERAFADRSGSRRVTPVEELLMSRPKTLFSDTFSSVRFALVASSLPPFTHSVTAFFFCGLTSRWSETRWPGAE